MAKLREDLEFSEGKINSMSAEVTVLRDANAFKSDEITKTENLIKKMDRDLKKQVKTKNKMS